MEDFRSSFLPLDRIIDSPPIFEKEGIGQGVKWNFRFIIIGFFRLRGVEAGEAEKREEGHDAGCGKSDHEQRLEERRVKARSEIEFAKGGFGVQVGASTNASRPNQKKRPTASATVSGLF